MSDRLQGIAIDPVESSLVSLGYFLFAWMGNIKCLFAIIGEIDPWEKTINSFRAALLEQVEVGWRSTGSLSLPHPNSRIVCVVEQTPVESVQNQRENFYFLIHVVAQIIPMITHK